MRRQLNSLMTFLVVMCSMAFFAGSAFAECLELGWSGGAAGKEIKYVKATIVDVDKDTGRVKMSYAWKNGWLDLSIIEDTGDSLVVKGTWGQDESKGGKAYLRFSNEMTKGVGYWTNSGKEEQFDLFLRQCK